MKFYSALCFALALLICSTVEATVVVSNGLTHIHESTIGNKIRGSINVKNIGEISEKIIIYKQDLLKFCDEGAPENPPAENHPRSLNSWIDISTLEKELAAGEEYSIIYDITVPNDENLNGSYWNMVIVEIARPVKRNQMDHGFTIESKIRYGIQIITNIGNLGNEEDVYVSDSTATKADAVTAEGEEEEEYEEDEGEELIEFVALELKEKDGFRYVETVIENSDVFMRNIAIVVDIIDPETLDEVAKIETPLKKVYPNSCTTFEIPMQEVAPGEYEALFTADYGKDLFGINVPLTIDAE